MRVTTRAVYRMTETIGEYLLVEDDAFEYEGPVLEAKKGGSSGTTVTKSEPWKEQKPYLMDLFSQAQQWQQQDRSYYPDFQTTVGFNPLQEQGFAGMLDYAGSPDLMNQLNAAMSGSNQALNPNSNPYVGASAMSLLPGQQALSQAAYRSMQPNVGITGASGPTDYLNQMMSATPNMDVWNPVMQGVTQNAVEDFSREILPMLRSEALGAGQYGGSRHQLATSKAADYMSENLLNTQNQLAQQAASEALQQRGLGAQLSMENAGLDLQGQIARESAMQNLYGQGIQSAQTGLSGLGNLYGTSGDMFRTALGVAPQTAQLGTYPSSIIGQVGAEQQGLSQQQMDEDVARFFAQQGGPLNDLNAYSNLIQGNYGGAQSNPYYENRLMQGLGGAALGLGAYSMLPTTSMMGLGASGTAGMFGGLGALAGLMSDRRLKEDVRVVGKLDNGLPVYTFRYIGSPHVQMGVMAQDVEKVIPEAVTTVAGVKHVNYAALGGGYGE